MRKTFALGSLIATVFTSSAAHAFDACSLISPAEMATAISEAVSTSSPSTSGEKNAPGVKTWDCTYWKGTTPIAVVTVQQFPSPDAARRHAASAIDELKHLTTESNEEGQTIQLLEEKGSGEHAFMTIDQDAGVTYNIVKKTRFLSIAVGQEHPNVEKLRASLKQLAANATAKF